MLHTRTVVVRTTNLAKSASAESDMLEAILTSHHQDCLVFLVDEYECDDSEFRGYVFGAGETD